MKFIRRNLLSVTATGKSQAYIFPAKIDLRHILEYKRCFFYKKTKKKDHCNILKIKEIYSTALIDDWLLILGIFSKLTAFVRLG